MTTISGRDDAPKREKLGRDRPKPGVLKPGAPRPNRRRYFARVSARAKILLWMLAVVALALAAIVGVTARFETARIETDAVAELAHEAGKLRVFATEPNPDTGLGYTSVSDLLTTYLSRTLPEDSETFFSIVDGAPERRSPGQPPVRLDRDSEFVQMAAALDVPKSGSMQSEAGPLMYAVIPVEVDGARDSGAFVAIEFLGTAYAHAQSDTLAMSLGAVVALLVAGLVGWFVAGRVLAPVREVREAADRISETDLDRRIEVSGADDVAQLAETFNRMLDRLQRAFELQRRFLDDAGHELRTPLTIIRGHLDLIDEEPVSRAETLALVQDEVVRMGRMVDELVELARTEQPDFVALSVVDLTYLVVETLAKASALADRAFSIDALPEGSIIADGQRLAQALLQLCSNAVAYTERGMRIAVGGTLDEAGNATLWVRDEGRGIPADEQERIFERFSRGDGALGLGNGIGLSIVARIAEAHGGSVTVDSQPGHGAQFTLLLPAREAKQAQSVDVQQEERRGTA